MPLEGRLFDLLEKSWSKTIESAQIQHRKLYSQENHQTKICLDAFLNKKQLLCLLLEYFFFKEILALILQPFNF